MVLFRHPQAVTHLSETLENKGEQQQTPAHTDGHTETHAIANGSGLTVRQERFAQLFIETGVAIEAYAAAYCCDGSSRNTIRVNAFRLLRQPKIAARVRELQDAIAGRSLRSTAGLVRDLEAMVEADPNELVRLDVGACRRCWGDGGGYQWRDAAELAAATGRYEAALESSKPLPAPADASGGFGYRAERESNPECDHCGGAGRPRVKFASTADVSPGARRLLRGIELFPDGAVKRLLLHDQMAARIELHRLRGLHIDRSITLNATVSVPALSTLTREQQLEFLNSLKPAI